jgi:hypothetical protein
LLRQVGLAGVAVSNSPVPKPGTAFWLSDVSGRVKSLSLVAISRKPELFIDQRCLMILFVGYANGRPQTCQLEKINVAVLGR